MLDYISYKTYIHKYLCLTHLLKAIKSMSER